MGKTALVHIGGSRFDVLPIVEHEGFAYTRRGGRWWKLSHRSKSPLHNVVGWRSFNVGMPDDFSPTVNRHCRIEDASIEDRNGGGDGAYGLLDVSGSPDEIGKAIADALREADMCRGPSWAYIEDGDSELYLNLRIRFARHELVEDAVPDPYL